MSNKETAKKYLEATDYAVLPDVELENKQEFIDYRNYLRQQYLYPSMGEVNPPPNPKWSFLSYAE